MLSLFDSPFVRRLKQDGLTGNRHLDFANLMNLYERGDIEDADPGRDLQESTSDVLTTLTISMISSSFEVSIPCVQRNECLEQACSHPRFLSG